MRVQTAYYLFILYTTLIFQPLLLITEDALSHAFADAIHIATVHAKYGNNHLQKELVTTSSENTNGKEQNNSKSDEQVTAHVCGIAGEYDFSLNSPDQPYFGFVWFKLPHVFSSLLTPPPEF